MSDATTPGESRRRPKEVWPSGPKSRSAVWRERWRVARESVGFLGRAWPATIVVWLLIGIALALPGALYLLGLNLERAAGDWQGRPGLSVYFEPGLDIAVATALADRLRGDADVVDVYLVTPEEALAELGGQSALADSAHVFDALDTNPLPATIRASLALDSPPERLVELAGSLLAAAGVDDVVIEKTWIERLAAMREVVERIAIVVALLLGVGAVLVSAASVRLAIAARLAEQEVLALVGATRRHIRRPFLYLGVLYGAGGALVAAVLLSGALIAVEEPLAQLFESYGADLYLAGFDPMFLLALFGTGAVLGALGARLAANRPP